MGAGGLAVHAPGKAGLLRFRRGNGEGRPPAARRGTRLASRASCATRATASTTSRRLMARASYWVRLAEMSLPLA